MWRAIVSKFSGLLQGIQEMVSSIKNVEVVGRGPESIHFLGMRGVGG